MKKAFCIILAIASCTFAKAQMMPDSTVQIVAYWEKGDQISYDCASSQYVIDADGTKTVKEATSETRTFEVIDADEDGYTIRVSYSDVFSPAPVEYMTNEQMKELSEAITVTFKTDQLGTFKGIVDDEESFNAYTRMVDTIMDNVWDSNKKELKGISKEKFLEPYREAFTNKESMLIAMMSEVTPLLMFHGCRLDTTQVYTYPQTFNNMFNPDEPLQLDTQFWVDEKLTDETSAVIRTDAAAGAEMLLPMVKESTLKVVKASMEAAGVEYDEAELAAEADKTFAENGASVSFEEYTTIEVHLATGWPICWYSTREVTTAGIDKAQTVIIEKSVELHQP